ncbi:MAG: HD domain-containing protein [Gammaproteobacteria bacterium]|nr:HD domain-containing protein [Pseudomonadales bacterium]MCP5345439.1 HD domain-containing protein [Pseudomonadales bacterium]
MTEHELEAVMADYMSGRVSTDPAHDILHVRRVVSLARALAESEGADLRVVLPAAWLHDCITLPKDSPDKHRASTLAAQEAIRFLKSIDYPYDCLEGIYHAIQAHSYSAAIRPRTLEARVVQDADRLDALGAIGIARCILVGGALHTPLYEPDDAFCERRQPADRQYVLDHFYTKLLHLPQSLHTPSARLEARRRRQAILFYLDELRRELSVSRIRNEQYPLL